MRRTRWCDCNGGRMSQSKTPRILLFTVRKQQGFIAGHSPWLSAGIKIDACTYPRLRKTGWIFFMDSLYLHYNGSEVPFGIYMSMLPGSGMGQPV